MLVDGVGRPRLIEIEEGAWPAQLGFAREGVRSGPDRLATFLCTGEIDVDGRMVYRLEGTKADIRTAYLTLTPIASFNPPRVT